MRMGRKTISIIRKKDTMFRCAGVRKCIANRFLKAIPLRNAQTAVNYVLGSCCRYARFYTTEAGAFSD
jgi:hypothetical protein